MGDAEDLVAFFGTEFEEIESEKDGISKKPLSVENQVVTDEKGRRRFHGAFTGGFSAGYFNTVGSKEGWTPSSFKSTRSEREDERRQRPEDFMDQDDLGEYGIAPRMVQATTDFSGERKGKERETGKRRLAWEHDGTQAQTVQDPLADMIQPAKESVGIEMLKRMGWRQGQGIGPRMTRKLAEQASTSGEKVYGCQLPPGEESPSLAEIETMMPGFSFGPEDVDAHSFEDKNDVHGLGYRGLDPGKVLDETYASKPSKTRGRKGIQGQAFGVGAFEDDDDDIYGVDDLAKYDYSLGGFGSSSFLDKNSRVEEDFIPGKSFGKGRTFFPPPKLPSGFLPSHKPVIFKKESMPSELRELGERLNPIQRARLLGETYSVMSLIKMEDRDRMRARDPPRDSSAPKASAERTRDAFAGDRQKRKRFEEYISYLRRGLNMPQPVDLTEWEWERETKEFRRHVPENLVELLPALNAQKLPLAPPGISRPFAHLLKSKFTHASDGDSTETSQLKCDEDQAQAVKMKMFGTMTRKKHEWHPHRSLCKKFNLPDPYPDSHSTGVPHMQKRSRKEEDMLLGGSMLPTTERELANRREEEHSSHPGQEGDAPGYSEESPQLESNVVEERPSLDLFKAIFASDEEEEEDSDSGAEEKVLSLHAQLPGGSNAEERSMDIVKGWTDPTQEIKPPSPRSFEPLEEPRECDVKMEVGSRDMSAYGPALPPQIPAEDILLLGAQSRWKKEKKQSKKKKSKKEKKKKKKRERHRPKKEPSPSTSASTVDLSSDE